VSLRCRLSAKGLKGFSVVAAKFFSRLLPWGIVRSAEEKVQMREREAAAVAAAQQRGRHFHQTN
jgi:hypothetical protein